MIFEYLNMFSNKNFLHKLLKGMKLIRFLEEGIADRYSDGKMRCPTHLSTGQEASAVGVAAALQKGDLVVSTHRAHAHYLAKGGDMRAMLAEIYGKATGCAGGKGGSMHLVDRSVGFIGSTAIVANSIPLGVGLALSLQLKKSHQIAVSFFGDGAVEEGVFYESLNFAAVRKLPILFVCENNFYSTYAPLSVRQPEYRKNYKMVEAIGVSSAIVDGNNVEDSFKYALEAVRYIRNSSRPFFLEMTTYRLREHCGPNFDNDIGYRTEEEFEKWKERDPIQNFEKILLQQNNITQTEIEVMNVELLLEINNAFKYAENSPFPTENTAYKGLYANT